MYKRQVFTRAKLHYCSGGGQVWAGLSWLKFYVHHSLAVRPLSASVSYLVKYLNSVRHLESSCQMLAVLIVKISTRTVKVDAVGSDTCSTLSCSPVSNSQPHLVRATPCQSHRPLPRHLDRATSFLDEGAEIQSVGDMPGINSRLEIRLTLEFRPLPVKSTCALHSSIQGSSLYPAGTLRPHHEAGISHAALSQRGSKFG